MNPAQPAFLPANPQSFSHSRGRSGPPPNKKVKGNPIITKYPPPPGYRGPQPPHQLQQWPQQQFYPHPQPAQQWPAQPIQAPYQAQPFHPQLQHHHSIPHPGYQPPMPQQHPRQHPANNRSRGRRQNSAPTLHTSNFPGAVLDGNGDPLLPPSSETNPHSLEHEFDEECYYLRHPNEIDPTFSLGEIVWAPPRPTKRALPSSFTEAEQQNGMLTRAHSVGDECVSVYFVSSRREEAFLSIRQLDRWNEVKDDPIFREFRPVCNEYLSLSELYDKYTDRPDPEWQMGGPSRETTATPEPSIEEPATPNSQASFADFDMSRRSSVDPIVHSSAVHSSVMSRDNQTHFWDQRLKEQDQAQSKRQNKKRSSHSRATSVASSTRSSKILRPVPVERVQSKDQAQEDILAALGVTGSPKQVYQTPGPALGAPPPAQAPRDYTTLPGLSVPSSQASIHHRNSSYDSNRRPNSAGVIGHKRNLSTQSNHSDIYMPDANTHSIPEAVEEEEATPRAPSKQNRSAPLGYGTTPSTAKRVMSGQKRRFEDFSERQAKGEADEGDSPDEATPRPARKKQPRVDSGSGASG